MADARRLVELGMVPPLAKEVAAQITAGVGNARRLAELSMVPPLAGELSAQITAKVGNVRRLAELTMVPVLAMEVAGQVGGGVVPPVAVALDAPVTAANLSKTYAAWSPHRFNDTYTGPTIRLKRLSDNAEMDFTPSASGELKASQVDAWSPAGNEDIVKVYSTVAGQPDLTARGTVAFRRAGVPQRFGCDSDPTTGNLTRSLTDGAIGADLNGIGDLVTLTPIVAAVGAKGMKMFQLASLHNRKISSTDTTDDTPGGNNTRENMLSYGADTLNQFFNYFGGGGWVDTSRVQSGTAQIQVTGRGVTRYRAKGQMVTMEVIGLADYRAIEHGKRVKLGTYPALTAAAIAAGSLDNKYVGVGCVLSGTGVFNTTFRMNGIWGGLVLMDGTTTAEEDNLMQAKISLIGQPHLAISKAELLAMTDDGVDFTTANPATGLVTSRNALFALQLNTSGSTWAYAATQSDVGIKGLRSPDLSILNSYKAVTNYWWDAIYGGSVTYGYTETNAQSGNLAWQFATAAGNPQVDNRGDWSFAAGNHHATPAVVTKPAASKDPQGLVTGNRFYEDETQMGSDNYDDAKGQEHLKYAYVAPHRKLDYTTVDKAGYVYTKATCEKTDPLVPKKIRDPVYPSYGDNTNYPFKVEQACLQIVTFEPDPSYDRNASYALRKPALSKGIVKSYLSGGGICPLGHVDGSICIDTSTPVRDADPTHFMQTQIFQYPFQGIRSGQELVDFEKRARPTWTFLEAQKLQANNYKRYA